MTLKDRLFLRKVYAKAEAIQRRRSRGLAMGFCIFAAVALVLLGITFRGNPITAGLLGSGGLVLLCTADWLNLKME